MMLRAMAPDVVVIDELGGEQDIQAVRAAMHAGVRLVATMHGFGVEPAYMRIDIQKMVDERLFERYVVLNQSRGPGTVEGIYNQDLQNIYQREGLK